MVAASVVLFSSRGRAALQETLHAVWHEAADVNLAVITTHCDATLAEYLMQQYRRGRIRGLGLAPVPRDGGHCGIDRVAQFLDPSAECVVRLSDGLDLHRGWLDKAMIVMQDVRSIGCLGLVGTWVRHRPGPARKLAPEVVEADVVDTECFVARRELVELHCARLPRRTSDGRCDFQAGVRRLGFQIGHLGGLATRVSAGERASDDTLGRYDGDLPYHGSPANLARRLRQTYELGQEVLCTCLSCGSGGLDVLTAEIEFCASHDVAIGHTYTLRCPQCGRLQFEEDLQLTCPSE